MVDMSLNKTKQNQLIYLYAMTFFFKLIFLALENV